MMLPNKLISQNPGGIMLFLALSEAIHCQTKRRPKIKLPLQPMIFQAFTSTAASCKIAKRDCMRSLSHRIFFAATWGALPRFRLRQAYGATDCEAAERSATWIAGVPGCGTRPMRSERSSVGAKSLKMRHLKFD